MDKYQELPRGGSGSQANVRVLIPPWADTDSSQCRRRCSDEGRHPSMPLQKGDVHVAYSGAGVIFDGQDQVSSERTTSTLSKRMNKDHQNKIN